MILIVENMMSYVYDLVSLAQYRSMLRRIFCHCVTMIWTRRDFRGSSFWGFTFEPEAPYLQGRCSTRLSYGPINMIEVWIFERLVKK